MKKIVETAKVKVVGEHNRRTGSRYFAGYELLKRTPTVGAFLTKFKPRTTESGRAIVRAAIKDGYIKVA